MRDYVYVDDVVDANLRAARGEIAARVANVASGSATTTLELAERHEARHAAAAPRSAARRAGPATCSARCSSPRPARRPPVPLDEGLRQTLEWFRSQAAR